MNILSILALLISTTIIYSAPLAFTAIGGTFSERGGVVNVGLEGIMTMGAFSSIVFNLSFGNSLGQLTPWLGLVVGAIVGLAIAWLHALATVTLRADHIVSGTVINLIAPALGVFLIKVIYGKGQTDQISQSFGYSDIPLLDRIPILGRLFFHNTSYPALLSILVAFLTFYIIYKTRFGLRLRSVGENPQAADTLGLNVARLRYEGVLISGLLGGIGGALYAESIALNFAVSTIAGQGFISMAAMIFGRWNPIGAMLAAMFFGLSQSLSVIGAQIPLINQVPSVWLQIFPYVLTIIILTIFFGKTRAPKADGVNYIKSE
ncbi:ABC transporter permease [Oenococcus kitaharae]|uniref:Unspecified monosaccharide ABC transport systempermease component 2 n=1 Tax=Oenococcus kitaharae DSM 17330 TaxID=1045004 RepID=G9WHF8_9LACO|nr:ABC transporter permease [Oenococcus kitaharae]EHN58297.1 Unspecified monosaccharide ABC transport systempermease component 2 [Oenococcus kitaharae DSM 17330]OEY81526.1 sugar ABC transporter permease [Oenococcus kitaharae]OEY83013.1 sugar ABC transporter permease [Oenococcus kitaharae]OEY84442.1 sugar ABC transporter permease [Oenococcus kitaharae]